MNYLNNREQFLYLFAKTIKVVSFNSNLDACVNNTMNYANSGEKILLHKIGGYSLVLLFSALLFKEVI